MLVTASGQSTIKAPCSKTLAPSNSSLHGILQHPGRSPQLFAAAMQIKHPSFHLSTSDFFFPKASYMLFWFCWIATENWVPMFVCLFDRFCAFNSLNHHHLSINVPSIHHHHCHPHHQDRGPLTPSNRGRWNHRWIVDCEIWSGPASKSSNNIPVFHPLKTCHRFQVSFCDAISAEAPNQRQGTVQCYWLRWSRIHSLESTSPCAGETPSVLVFNWWSHHILHKDSISQND